MDQRTDLAKEFQENLRAARLRSGVSTRAIQEVGADLAEVTGVASFAVERSSVTRYETATWPTVPKLITLARAYRIPVEELLAPLLNRIERDTPEDEMKTQKDEVDVFARLEHRRYHVLLEFILEHGERDKEIAGIAAQLEALFELLCRRRGRRESPIGAGSTT